jgi:serine/threonine protein kinase
MRSMIAARRARATLGRYELEEIIGRGGVAEAWRANFVGAGDFRKTVVIKRVRPELREHTELHAAFGREARLAQRLQHANVVQLLDLGDDDGVPYLVLEHVDGCSLQTLMEHGTLALEHALYVAEQVASALEYVHAAEDEHGAPLGLVHRDVTPGNVLLSRDGAVKLGDFGIARALGAGNDTLPGFIKGTPIYLAPEQAGGRPIDARADIFSLGLVLRRMLVGDAALDGVDPELVAIVEAATEPSIRDRLPSAAALRGRLRAFRGAHGIDEGGPGLAVAVREAIGKPRVRTLAIDAALEPEPGVQTRQLGSSPAALASATPRVLAIVAVLAAAAIAVVMWPSETSHDGAPLAAPAPIQPSPGPHPGPSPAPGPEPIPHAPVATPTREPEPATTADTPAKPPRPKPARGRLRVNVIPWAEVELDGKPIGRTNVDRPLDAGRHVVRLYNPEIQRRAEHEVLIEAGKSFAITSW